MQLKSIFFVLASLVVAGLSSSVTDVKNDISTLSGHVTTLDNQVTSFTSASGLAAGLAIHSSATTIESDLNKGNTDVQNVTPLPISEADASAILTALEGIAPTIIHSLQQIAAKKAQFQALPVGNLAALVKTDLTTLRADTTTFENSLIAKTPSDLLTRANTLRTNIDNAFAAALAAYADV